MIQNNMGIQKILNKLRLIYDDTMYVGYDYCAVKEDNNWNLIGYTEGRVRTILRGIYGISEFRSEYSNDTVYQVYNIIKGEEIYYALMFKNKQIVNTYETIDYYEYKVGSEVYQLIVCEYDKRIDIYDWNGEALCKYKNTKNVRENILSTEVHLGKEGILYKDKTENIKLKYWGYKDNKPRDAIYNDRITLELKKGIRITDTIAPYKDVALCRHAERIKWQKEIDIGLKNQRDKVRS